MSILVKTGDGDLVTIHTIDDLEEIVATAARQDALLAALPAVLGQGTMAQSLKVAVASDQSVLPTYPPAATWLKANADITRPNNTTVYAVNVGIGDAGNCIFTFSSFFRANAGTGLLTNAKLVINKASIAVPSGISIRGHVYNASPTAPASDQAAHLSLLANADAKLGTIDFSTFSVGGTGSDIIESYGVLCTSGPLPIKAASADNRLFLVLESRAAWTPVAQMIFRPYLMAENN